MSGDTVQVIELAAWGLDQNPYRPDSTHSGPVRPNPMCTPESAVAWLDAETEAIAPLLPAILEREDLQREFAGRCWHIGVVHLHCLIAFQRRLTIRPGRRSVFAPRPDDWPALLTLAFGPPRPTDHTWLDGCTVSSPNPDLQLRRSANGLELYGGSPFLEVAHLGGLALLRDGYHRVFDLLTAGIHAVPAVVLEAHTLADVYPESPWFFPPEVVLGPDPPRLPDFLKPALTLRYTRPRLVKKIHLSLRESFEVERNKEHTQR